MKPDWKPIETAPKDGTPVIVFRKSIHCVMAESMSYSEESERWHWIDDGDMPDDEFQPTHWLCVLEKPE